MISWQAAAVSSLKGGGWKPPTSTRPSSLPRPLDMDLPMLSRGDKLAPALPPPGLRRPEFCLLSPGRPTTELPRMIAKAGLAKGCSAPTRRNERKWMMYNEMSNHHPRAEENRLHMHTIDVGHPHIWRLRGLFLKNMCKKLVFSKNKHKHFYKAEFK